MRHQLKIAIDGIYAFIDKIMLKVKNVTLFLSNNSDKNIINVLILNYLFVFIAIGNVSMILATVLGMQERTAASKHLDLETLLNSIKNKFLHSLSM